MGHRSHRHLEKSNSGKFFAVITEMSQDNAFSVERGAKRGPEKKLTCFPGVRNEQQGQGPRHRRRSADISKIINVLRFHHQ